MITVSAITDTVTPITDVAPAGGLMRIGIVGGLDRAESLFAQLATAAGHQALFHDGSMTASGVRALLRVLEHADLVLLLTDVNSHGAVRHARQVLREQGRAPVLMRRCGSARFAALLATLETRAQFVGAHAS
jgi:ethanolamine utilization protein EutP (predicted NTPase)